MNFRFFVFVTLFFSGLSSSAEPTLVEQPGLAYKSEFSGSSMDSKKQCARFPIFAHLDAEKYQLELPKGWTKNDQVFLCDQFALTLESPEDFLTFMQERYPDCLTILTSPSANGTRVSVQEGAQLIKGQIVNTEEFVLATEDDGTVVADTSEKEIPIRLCYNPNKIPDEFDVGVPMILKAALNL